METPHPAQYREPGSNRHAHHWAKDFKSFLSTNSNIAASGEPKSAAKVLLFFYLRKFFCSFLPKLLHICGFFTTFALAFAFKLFVFMNQYTHRYSITAADMDTHYRMTPSAVLLYYQDCWARHMACLHLAAFDIVHQNLMWVISEFNAWFEPAQAFWSQDVNVTVWNSELTSLRLYVEFRMTNTDGTLLASGYGCWTLLDTRAHRLTANSVIADRLPILPEMTHDGHRKIRLPEGTTVRQQVEHRVNPINLDFNGHVNNRTYLSIAMQTVSGDWAEQHSIRQISIRWLRETFLGDTLLCRLWQTPEPNTFLHVITKNDEPVAQIYSELTLRTDNTIVDDAAPRV